jgi:hypothetical protein
MTSTLPPDQLGATNREGGMEIPQASKGEGKKKESTKALFGSAFQSLGGARKTDDKRRTTKETQS